MISKWDLRFLELANQIATWSKDPSTKVGAVIADGKHVVSIGYNGFPPGVDDNPEWLEDRSNKYSLTIHAEVNAVLNANRPVSGYTLYATPLAPCPDCAKHLAAAGIKRVVCKVPEEYPDRWADKLDLVKAVFERNGISFEIH